VHILSRIDRKNAGALEIHELQSHFCIRHTAYSVDCSQQDYCPQSPHGATLQLIVKIVASNIGTECVVVSTIIYHAAG
jgi:hypothetical protein